MIILLQANPLLGAVSHFQEGVCPTVQAGDKAPDWQSVDGRKRLAVREVIEKKYIKLIS